MAKPKMTPLPVTERLLVVEPPEWVKPMTDAEALDVLWLAASGGAAGSWALHQRVTEERDAFTAYRGASGEAADRENALTTAFMEAYRAHDTEAMKRIARERHAALEEAKAYEWLPYSLTFADGASQEATSSLLKAMQGRRLISTLWAALLVAKHDEYVEGLPEWQRRAIKVAASNHLEFRGRMERATDITADPRRHDPSDVTRAEKVIEAYSAAIEESRAWNL